jgi:phage baseplate assembly protein gpV
VRVACCWVGDGMRAGFLSWVSRSAGTARVWPQPYEDRE